LSKKRADSQLSIESRHCKFAAYTYAIDRKDEKQLQFQNILRGIGFQVKLKNYTTRKDGSSKGDWDVGIAIDMLETTPDVDRLILLSGDGDFDILLQKIKTKGKKVDVYGVPKLTADSLVQAASTFHAIDKKLLLKY
jgi:uncharacterized LabA/DUF88 family protein